MSEDQMPGDQQSSSCKKGILKKSPRPSDAASDHSVGEPTAGSPIPHLKWDEANILWTEANRTATMKIDEPKTPFVRPEEIQQLDILEMRLEMGSGNGSRVSLSSAPSCSEFSDSGPSYRHNTIFDEELDTEEAKRKHEEFERRRQQHYEMKEALRRGRELIESENEHDDDDDTDEINVKVTN